MKRGWRIMMWILFGVLMVALFGVLTKFLWNWLVPALFGGPVINFWQALGLLLLSKILFSGFNKHHNHGSHKPYWKKRLQEKFSTMSPEEREAFKKKMREKWCPQSDTDADSKS